MTSYACPFCGLEMARCTTGGVFWIRHPDGRVESRRLTMSGEETNVLDGAAIRQEALRAFAEDAERSGLRADLQPTGGHMRPWGWWQSYLERADTHLRERAREALREAGPRELDPEIVVEQGGTTAPPFPCPSCGEDITAFEIFTIARVARSTLFVIRCAGCSPKLREELGTEE